MDFFELALKYGAQAVIVAIASIFLVGCIKLIFSKPLEKISKEGKKPLYEVLSIVFTYALVVLWVYGRTAWFHLDYDPFTWQVVAAEGSAAYLVVKVLYPMYESLGVRTFLRSVGNWFLSWFKKKTEEKVEDKK